MLNNLINNKLSKCKDDCKGLSYIELIIALASLSTILLVLYSFLSFSFDSLIYVSAKFDSTQDARVIMIEIGDHIRKSRNVRFDGNSHKAVEADVTGNKINIYVDVDDDGECELVQYKLDNNKLIKGQAELGSTPTTWYTIIDNIYNDRLDIPKPIFTINNKTINIELYIKDEFESLSKPICVNGSYSVRSKGGMS